MTYCFLFLRLPHVTNQGRRSAVRNVIYEPIKFDSTLRLLTDDGSNPKIAKIKKVSEKINTQGQVTVLGHRGIHRVDNISGKPSTSIHVYGRDIGHAERHSSDPVTGEIGRFVSGYCNVLRDTERF